MAAPCDGTCTEMKCDDGWFEYRMDITGENGEAKKMESNALVFMEDVECYSIRLRQRRIQKDTEYIPCAKVSIDGKSMGLFIIPDNFGLEIGRFPSNGDVICFVTTRNFKEHPRVPTTATTTTPAFGNVSTENMGLIKVAFGICNDKQLNDQNAYFRTETCVPKPCMISSRDVKPLLESLNLRDRKRGYDEPDCGPRKSLTIEGGTLRFGNANTMKIAETLFQTCAVTQYETCRLAVRLVGTLDSRKRSANGKNLRAKGIDGNNLDSGRFLSGQFPPRADVTF